MTPETWAIVELMGHCKISGRLSEEEKFGSKLGRLDIPQEDGTFVTRYFGGASVYGIAVVSEAVARHVAKQTSVSPVSPWDFPKQLAAPVGETFFDHPNDEEDFERDEDDDEPEDQT